jgi:hypothetical protein
MQILKPSSHRGTFTTWRATDARSLLPARITRSIDIDGDESWGVAIYRNQVWAPDKALCGRNTLARQKIERALDCLLYEVEDMPSPEPHEDRRKLMFLGLDEMSEHKWELPALADFLDGERS